MNAAAKMIQETNFFSGQFADIRMSKPLVLQISLLVVLMLTALAVIYTSNMQRLAFSQLQAAEQQTNQLQLQWGQLLLEQASLATPARVEELAAEKLHMLMPVDKQVLILRLK